MNIQNPSHESMISLIAAVAKDTRVIGYHGRIPWQDDKEIFAADMNRFVNFTLGNSVIMGRRTYDSLPSNFKPLPDRTNIVVTRNISFSPGGVIVCHSVSEALDTANSFKREAYIIGGEQIYRQTIDLAQRLEITEVKGNFKGDAFFPEIDFSVWSEKSRDKRAQYAFVAYERRVYPVSTVQGECVV